MSGTARCPECRREVPWTNEHWDSKTQTCRSCAAALRSTPESHLAADSAPTEAESSSSLEAPRVIERGVQTGAPLTIIGILFMLVGLWHLLNPGMPGYEGALLGRDVVNLQRLAIREAFTIAGVIFLAAAWRPR